ncbi:unnamed protein product [Linum trigynum]|uniref:Uncharacterized protein n=1 Tax=Linum trigynum TaxID=586398 RepID=A0AAV2FAJ4_9ROSI
MQRPIGGRAPSKPAAMEEGRATNFDSDTDLELPPQNLTCSSRQQLRKFNGGDENNNNLDHDHNSSSPPDAAATSISSSTRRKTENPGQEATVRIRKMAPTKMRS